MPCAGGVTSFACSVSLGSGSTSLLSTPGAGAVKVSPVTPLKSSAAAVGAVLDAVSVASTVTPSLSAVGTPDVEWQEQSGGGFVPVPSRSNARRPSASGRGTSRSTRTPSSIRLRSLSLWSPRRGGRAVRQFHRAQRCAVANSPARAGTRPGPAEVIDRIGPSPLPARPQDRAAGVAPDHEPGPGPDQVVGQCLLRRGQRGFAGAPRSNR